ncbi:unnamed protein product, partial [Nesidiocoris tenuis]
LRTKLRQRQYDVCSGIVLTRNALDADANAIRRQPSEPTVSQEGAAPQREILQLPQINHSFRQEEIPRKLDSSIQFYSSIN